MGPKITKSQNHSYTYSLCILWNLQTKFCWVSSIDCEIFKLFLGLFSILYLVAVAVAPCQLHNLHFTQLMISYDYKIPSINHNLFSFLFFFFFEEES